MANDTHAHETSSPTPLAPEAGIAPLDFNVRAKLSVMMFLQYFVWGSWFVALGTYLEKTLQFSGTQVGSAFSVSAIAAIAAPFFVGMIADRFFATQNILCVLHLTGAGLLYYASTLRDFGPFYVVLLLYFLCYMPTLALTNSISFHHLNDPDRQFPGIRVLGTIGWIAAGLLIGWLKLARLNTPMQIAAASSVLLGLYCLGLPNTPPPSRGQRVSWRNVLGIDALALMKQWPFAVFVIGSFLICIPLQFYYVWTNPFLDEIGVENATGKMTYGQMSEIFFMLIMPLLLLRLGVKYMLLIGMAAWALRYVLFAYGRPGDSMWMLYIGILLHGICYDFFFVTGYLYVDRKAPPAIRGAAQGFIALVTLGVGGFIGMQLSGFVVDAFRDGSAHDWQRIWLVPAAVAGVVLILFAALFRDRMDAGRVDNNQ